jgi:hypothetical protein
MEVQIISLKRISFLLNKGVERDSTKVTEKDWLLRIVSPAPPKEKPRRI